MFNVLYKNIGKKVFWVILDTTKDSLDIKNGWSSPEMLGRHGALPIYNMHENLEKLISIVHGLKTARGRRFSVARIECELGAYVPQYSGWYKPLRYIPSSTGYMPMEVAEELFLN